MVKVDLSKFQVMVMTVDGAWVNLYNDYNAVIAELKASRKIIKCLRKIRTSDCGDLEEIYKALDELDGNNV